MILMGAFQLEMFSDSSKNCSWLQNSAGRLGLRHCNLESHLIAKRRFVKELDNGWSGWRGSSCMGVIVWKI